MSNMHTCGRDGSDGAFSECHCYRAARQADGQGRTEERVRLLKIAELLEADGDLDAATLRRFAHALIEYGPIEVKMQGDEIVYTQNVRIMPPIDQINMRGVVE